VVSATFPVFQFIFEAAISFVPASYSPSNLQEFQPYSLFGLHGKRLRFALGFIISLSAL